MAEQADPSNRSWHASRGQRQNDFFSNRSLVEMNPAGTDLGNEVEQGVRSDGQDRRHSQEENQDGQQEHTAAHSGHADQSTDHEADQSLFDEHSKSLCNGVVPLQSDCPFTPIKPSRSRCRMISCAASSGLRSAVLITTSASFGSSYGSEIPVNSLRMPARALA